MSFKQWDPTNLPIRPGIYMNFVKAAVTQLTGGTRGTVGIPLLNYNGTADAGKFYTVTNEQEAVELFGFNNIQSIRFALQGGAREVLVYTAPSEPLAEDYINIRDAFESRHFNVFVYDGEVPESEHTATLTWLDRCRKEKKHFFYVAGGTAADDQDIETGNLRSTLLDDDYVVNLVSGVVIGDNEYSSGEFAPYIAGLIAGTPINQSITYLPVRVDDVTKRFKNSEIISALEAGSLVLVHDGEKVIIEQGICTSGDKIRKVSGRQAVATDLNKIVRDNYIGRLTNNEAGQMTLISAVKAYLETLESENVLTDLVVELDSDRPSEGDKVFINIAYTELDSMERVFLSINI